MVRDSGARKRDDDDDDALSSFLSNDSVTPSKRVDALVNTARRSDDPLLGALSLVLAANHDYAKSVSSLLNTDLSQGQSLTEIKERLTLLLQKTDTLVSSQEELLQLLNELPETYKEAVEFMLKAHEERHSIYLDAKFSRMFQAVGLKKDGEDLGEADSLIRKVKYLVSKQVMSVVVGMVLYNLAVWIIEHAGKISK